MGVIVRSNQINIKDIDVLICFIPDEWSLIAILLNKYLTDNTLGSEMFGLYYAIT